MYSVLIVDDEEPVLDSYSYLVESELEEFEVGATARTGGEAIRAAHSRRPDVVLMDIAMPGMDGLDTIGEMQHQFPDALYILSTAYERFDLAQRAIPLHVFAYLVKPVSRKRFLETMFRAKDALDEERARLTQRLQEAERDEETIARQTQDFMLLLTWKPFDATTWRRFKSLLKLPSDTGFVLALDSSRSDLYACVAERVVRRYWCIWAENTGRMIILVADPAPPEVVEQYVRGVADELLEPGDTFSVAAGSRRRYDELYLSCDEALNAIPPVAGSEQRLRHFRARVREFGQAVARARTAADVGSLYQTLTDDVFTSWSFHVAKYRVAVAFERLLHDFDSRIGSPELSPLVADPVKDVAELETRKEVDAWAQRLLRRLVEEQTRYAGAQWPAVLKQAVQYIDSHYAQPLQLTAVAERCNVSAGYLSRLFSEHLGVSFNDHLNAVRLDIAERLLREGEQPVKEIAYSVGYHDPNYFSRIFKKFKGTSPTTFSRKGGTDA